MQDNPYAVFAQELKKTSRAQQQVCFRTGVVSSAAPLTVMAGGLALSGKDLLINAALLPQAIPVKAAGIKGSLSGECSGCGDCPGGGISLTLSSGETQETLTRLAGALAPGDRVALLTGDDQTFVVLCKVVQV